VGRGAAAPPLRARGPGGATGPDRRRAHRALSAAADDLELVELGAWHAAKATVGTDPAVADRLEQAADRAGRRGGSASRAGMLMRAAALTPAGPVKDTRLMAAAEAALAAGAAALAGTLVNDLAGDRLDPVTRGRWITARVNLAYFTGSPEIVRSPADMVTAAEALHGRDPGAEQRALVKAFGHAITVDRLNEPGAVRELGRRLVDGATLGDGVAATIMLGLGAYVLRPYPQAVPLLRRAAAEIAGLGPADTLLYGPIGVAVAAALWDERAMRDGLRRTEAAARELGSLYPLDSVLWLRSLVALRTESPQAAQQYAEQVEQVRRVTGHGAGSVVNVALLAWSGSEPRRVETLAAQARAVGLGAVHASAIGALAALDLAEGRYAGAYSRLKPFVDEPFLQATPLDYPDFVEAAARAGHLTEAARFVVLLEEFAGANGSAWTLGVTQRSRALISADDEAEGQYLAAIETLAPTVLLIDTGRAHLLYGEWLRRLRRRRDARNHLRHAAEIFDAGAAPVFARRARHELEVLGERPVAVALAHGSTLTAQEAAVARLAAAGNTNAEIGATMFISANTVDYHLRKVFQKLGVTSRRHLAHRLGPATAPR
jgi:DNA-binding CsgD family transcriptional regulator